MLLFGPGNRASEDPLSAAIKKLFYFTCEVGSIIVTGFFLVEEIDFLDAASALLATEIPFCDFSALI